MYNSVFKPGDRVRINNKYPAGTPQDALLIGRVGTVDRIGNSFVVVLMDDKSGLANPDGIGYFADEEMDAE